ncbi:MAG: signal peptidase II, partial [Clostridia bacterium]|nr:signal peptidase II [Clostridia bacterium]
FGFAERKGAVLDFIDCRFIHFYVFNVADACVTVGCFLYLFLIILAEIKAAKEKKTAPAEGGSAEDGGGSSSEETAGPAAGEGETEENPEAQEEEEQPEEPHE